MKNETLEFSLASIHRDQLHGASTRARSNW